VSAPALLAISHGTSSPSGQRAVATFVAAVARRRPEFTVLGGFVDVQRPDVDDVLAALRPDRPAVVVPLLLSAGYHVHVDLARSARGADRPVRVARALGPDDRLVRLLASRLIAAGLASGDRVVLACAGSSDPRAVEDCRAVAASLDRRLGLAVRPGFISAASPALAQAVSDAADAARADGGRVLVASYLLAPGYFAELARGGAADLVTAPLLAADEEPPDVLVDLVWDRYDEVAPGGSLSSAAGTGRPAPPTRRSRR
jgi:sirohydrochlorin ferrochelatase